MFTVCPKCTLTLALTANDLRVGQGYVRCGRCSNVFNALLKLSDAPADADGGDDAPPIPQADPASSSQITRAISSESAKDGAAPAGARAAPAAVPGTPAASVASSTAATRAAGDATSPAPASPPASAGAQPQQLPATHTLRADMNAPLPSEPSQAQGDTEAVDQFELVLKTLGLSLDEDEPPLRPPMSDGDASAGSDPSATSTRVIENIVLEGEGVSQSQAEVTDKPLDRLDQFARRLSTNTGKSERAPSPGAHAASARTPPPRSPRSPAARGQPATFRAPAPPVTGRPPPAANRVPPAARAHGAAGAGALRGPAARAPSRAGGDAHEVQQSELSRVYEPHAIAFEEEADLDDALLDDPMLDEPIAGESVEGIELVEGAREASDLDIPTRHDGAPLYRRLWLVGCITLALLLLLQMVNHWRERLAASPTWGPGVRALYADVGAPIAPHWDIAAYEVRQQGAESEPGERQRIRVRFSLANHATRAQPVPLLRLTLLDRYGRRVAERDLTPAEYWPRGHAPAAFLRSDERIDTQVQVRDPSADSASFELDVCLRQAPGALRCAGDASANGAEPAAAVGPSGAAPDAP